MSFSEVWERWKLKFYLTMLSKTSFSILSDVTTEIKSRIGQLSKYFQGEDRNKLNHQYSKLSEKERKF